jgi:hypothetical protein
MNENGQGDRRFRRWLAPHLSPERRQLIFDGCQVKSSALVMVTVKLQAGAGRIGDPAGLSPFVRAYRAADEWNDSLAHAIRSSLDRASGEDQAALGHGSAIVALQSRDRRPLRTSGITPCRRVRAVNSLETSGDPGQMPRRLVPRRPNRDEPVPYSLPAKTTSGTLSAVHGRVIDRHPLAARLVNSMPPSTPARFVLHHLVLDADVGITRIITSWLPRRVPY